MRRVRSGPGDFAARLRRAEAIVATPATEGPLRFLRAVLAYQSRRAVHPDVAEAGARVGAGILTNRLSDRYPLLDTQAAVDALEPEVAHAVAEIERSAVPPALGAVADELVAHSDLRGMIEGWVDDPSFVDPRAGMWLRLAGAPVLESAAAKVAVPSQEEWSGRACPACGDVPQCSAIVEESSGFMQGAPRYLVCGRCAMWWSFPRAMCAVCGEEDSRRVGPWVAEGADWIRIDACDLCRGYVKTFDLRHADARGAIPLVDDVATLYLDVWAHEQGLTRPGLSFAGV